eukprot:5261144-Pyramimonas_sp.AAC.1
MIDHMLLPFVINYATIMDRDQRLLKVTAEVLEAIGQSQEDELRDVASIARGIAGVASPIAGIQGS